MAPNFFIWCFLKSQVYVNKPKILDDLKASIRVEIVELTPQTLQKTMKDTLKRAHLCLQVEGQHLLAIVFKN